MLSAWAAACGVVLAAAPPIHTDGSLEPQDEVQRAATEAWARMEELYRAVTQVEPPSKGQVPVRIKRGLHLGPTRSGESRPGMVEIRQAREWVVDEKVVMAIRHELAHQFLWAVCPAASDDRLFHEAFAVATSGELSAWTEGDYLSIARAAKQLEDARSLDTAQSRKAIARILAETTEPGASLSSALQRRLKLCQADWRWSTNVTVQELSSRGPGARGSAFVVISRHSGEVLIAEGDARKAFPFGSTLKPFVLAGSSGAPLLSPRRGQPEWECGENLPAKVDAVMAMLRSCNGYFLDWAARAPEVAKLGAYGEVLRALGLARLPEDMTEAIGLRATLELSPLALAQAYRLLAESRPDVVEAMKENAAKGTLSGLGEASAALAGVATKTGTVRDVGSRPSLGWIVAVDEDRVAVMLRTGKMPRSFAGEFQAALERARAIAGQKAAKVQVLGLLPPEDVQARCPSAGFVATREGPAPVGRGFVSLKSLVVRGPALCLGAGWLVRFPGPGASGREYAGIFTYAPPPPYRPPPGQMVTERERRARRGSDFVFRTSELLYTAGVLAAEDATLTGEPRAALARVIAHDARHSRHPGRPVCDTTHCQAFLGTAKAKAEEIAALARPPLPTKEWLTFSQGGTEPWSERRPKAQVEEVLGQGASALRFTDGKALYVRAVTEGEAVYDAPTAISCELLRSPLKLPACPKSARLDGNAFVFEGRGKGHGEGLDIEWAKQSRASQDAILQRAYGFGAR